VAKYRRHSICARISFLSLAPSHISRSTDLELCRAVYETTPEDAAEQTTEEGGSAETVPSFDPSDLVVGGVLGSGAFCEIRTITSIGPAVPIDGGGAGEALLRTTDLRTGVDGGGAPRPVVKVLRTDLSEEDGRSGLADLRNEADHLRTLRHPHIVRLRGVSSAVGENGAGSGRFFLVLDRIRCTLEERIGEWEQRSRPIHSPMSAIYYSENVRNIIRTLTEERLSAAYGIASAMKYIHGKKIIYRDLKPQNIGFDARGRIKLFDFGLARDLAAAPASGDNFLLTGMTGTLRYMAPEVFKEEPYTFSADVYSFGIVMWYVYALRVPFSGYSCAMYRRLVVEEGKRPLADLGAWGATVCDLLGACWDPAPGTRPSFAEVCGVLAAHEAFGRGAAAVSPRGTFA